MGVYYGMNGLWVPIGRQGGAAPIDPNLLAENIKFGVTISGVTGTFTNDGTATALDMAEGKTAYINGEKITGVVGVRSSEINWSNATPSIDSNLLVLSRVVNDSNDVNGKLLRYGATLKLKSPISNFGNATASDVASGKTFTSSAGLKITGTGSIGGTIDTSKYTLLSKSGSSATIIDYVDDNGNYTPGIKISASELSGKTIYGVHLGLGIYDSDSGENYIEYLSYWNPTAVDGAEQIISFYATCYNGRVGTNSDILIPYGRSTAGVNVVSYSNGYISIAFEPQTGSSSPIYANTYSLENYILRVWYK